MGRSSGHFGKGLDHVSAGSEEGEACPSGALAWVYPLSSQPSCLAHDPVLKLPGPR